MRLGVWLGLFALSLSACANTRGRRPASDSTFQVVANDGTNPFAKVQSPAMGPVKIYGGYSAGCLVGAQPLPLQGPGYQVLRSSRNRFFGHPALVQLLVKAGQELGTQQASVTPLLIADMSQPRGGPMASGHASHQIGLDADVWLLQLDTPFREDMRETLEAKSVLQSDAVHLDAMAWKPFYTEQILWFAAQPEVERIFVNAAIKQRLCAEFPGDPRLVKLRPWFAHNDHFHVRLKCPGDQPNCVPQKPPDSDECEAEKLAPWYEPKAVERILAPKPTPIYSVSLPVECQNLTGVP